MVRRKNEKLEGTIFAACGRLAEKPSAADVLRELAKLRVEVGVSDRQVRRYLAAWDLLTEEKKRPYRLFYFPESLPAMIPWEGAGLVAPLLSEWLAKGKRPVGRLVLWFYRASLVAPGREYQLQERMAVALAIADLIDPSSSARLFRKVERHLLGLPPGRDRQAVQIAPEFHEGLDQLLFGVEVDE